MNTRAKGRRHENEYLKILQSQGITCELVKGSSKWNKSVDFFGVGDIIGFDQRSWYIVQVKTNSTAGALKKLGALRPLVPPNTRLIVAVRFDGGEWKTYNL